MEAINGKRFLNGVLIISMWYVWRVWNNKLHNNELPSPEKTAEDIEAYSFLWIDNRAKKTNFDLIAWGNFNFGSLL